MNNYLNRTTVLQRSQLPPIRSPSHDSAGRLDSHLHVVSPVSTFSMKKKAETSLRQRENSSESSITIDFLYEALYNQSTVRKHTNHQKNTRKKCISFK